MKIDCISDLHGYHPSLTHGDILIISGDCTRSDTIKQWIEFFHWMKSLDYKYKILVAGNHDAFLMNIFPKNQEEAEEYKEIHEFIGNEPNFYYLCNSLIEIEGMKIWGSPNSVYFDRVNPKYTAFMHTEKYLESIYEIIPKDIDILISHSPPFGICDTNKDGIHCGSHSLRSWIDSNKPRYVICGHIHEQGGKSLRIGHKTHVYNCSYVNERYQPMSESIRSIMC